jgi:Protein of unknown function (DUF2892)
MSALSTAFYVKNIPAWERVIRVGLAVGTAAYAFSLSAPWSWGLALTAVSFAVTGLFGFCPACAMLGRRSV